MRAILTYHSLDSSGSVISISPLAFRRHITHLVHAKVRCVTVDDLLADTGGTGDAVALTFDDGFVSVATEAAPLLADYGLPATLFVVTDCVGATNRWAAHDSSNVPRLPLLNWVALEKLALRGFTIASHTATHPDLTRLQPSRLAHEIDAAAVELARRLGSRPQGFAYPYGRVDEVARTAVGHVHSWACGTSFELLDGHRRLELPRIDMRYFERPGRFEQWGSGAFARWVRRRQHLRRVRTWIRRAGGP